MLQDAGATVPPRPPFRRPLYCTSDGIFWQVVIHTACDISAIALALIDRISQNHAVSGYIIDGKFVEQR